MNQMLLKETDPGIEYEAFFESAHADLEDILSEKQITLLVKRVYDVVFSALGLLCLVPVFMVVAVLIKLDSPGPVFYKQTRIGKDGREFQIYKFRKMHEHVGDGGSNLTLANDQRLTRMGAFIRKTKIDELPQAFNVLKGDMAVVGPRPETSNYVELYTPAQRQVLKVKPGITDYASIYFINEGDLLEQSTDPETYYIEAIMQQKIRLNKQYIQDMSFITDMKIIYKTFKNIILSL